MFGARVDGSLRFDTRVDSGGFNTGVKNLGSSLGRLRSSLLRVASAVGLAFSVATVINFGRTCIQTATEVENAWIGLNSIINGQGKSFDNAKKFLQEYISDGLVPLKNAVTAYKNLSLRGYNEEQIKAVMNSLKNSATYARQSQYTLGDAISTATEGLKNENSILVDNAGVTKNVAKMWQDYAKSIGVSSTSLTKQQKIQAEVNGILEETKFQMGDASRYSNSYSGQLARLSASFTALKTKIGNILKVIVGNFLPSINNAISAVESLADRVTALFNSWGIQTDIVDSLTGITDVATDSTDSLTDSIDETSEATEKLKNQLAGFDKLNVLKQEEEENTTPATTSTGELSTSVNVGVDTTQAEQSASLFTVVFDKLNKVLQPVIEALERLGEALKPLKEFSGKALESFYTNFLEPVGSWVINEGLPRFIDSITEMVDNINWDKINMALDNLWKALEPFSENVGEGLLWLWEEILTPLASWTISNVVPEFLNTLSVLLEGLNSVIDTLKEPAKWLMEKLLKPLGEWLSIGFSAIAEKIPSSLTGIFDKLSELLVALQPLFNWLIETVTPAVIMAVQGISWVLQGVCDFVSGIISGLLEVLTGVIDFLTGIFTGDWRKSWEGIVEIVKGVFGILSGIFNGISEVFAGLVLAVSGAIITILKTAWDIGSNLVTGILKGVTDFFGNIGSWIKEHIVDPWIESFKQLFGIHSPSTVMAEIGVFIIQGLLGGLKNKFVAVLDWIKTLPEKFKSGFVKIVDAIKQPFSKIADWFKTTFKNAWQGVKDVFSSGGKIFEGIKEGISSVFKTVVNGLIDGINFIISAPFNKINEMLNAIRNVEAFGARPFEFMWSENPLPVPQIPKLATGTVVPANYGEFTAILGDNKREPEIVSPLSTMKQAMKEVLEEMGVVGSFGNVEYRFVAELNGKPIFEEVVTQDKIDRKRHNGRSRLGTVR